MRTVAEYWLLGIGIFIDLTDDTGDAFSASEDESCVARCEHSMAALLRLIFDSENFKKSSKLMRL